MVWEGLASPLRHQHVKHHTLESSEPKNPLELAAEAIRKDFLDSGSTVTEMEPSDTERLQVSFVPRAKKTKQSPPASEPQPD
jgi:hypothetical protein